MAASALALAAVASLLALSLAKPPPAFAATDEIENCGFETGDFSGWDQDNNGPGRSVINDGTFDPAGPAVPMAPYTGDFSAVTDQDRPGTRTLFQDVMLSQDLASARFSWADKIRSFTAFSDPDQEFRVEVRTTADAFLEELFSTNPGDTLLNEWTTRSVDLSDYIGERVRLAFVQESSFFFNVHLDEVCLTVVTATRSEARPPEVTWRLPSNWEALKTRAVTGPRPRRP